MRAKLPNKGDVRIVFRDGAYVRWTMRPEGDCRHDPRKFLTSLKDFIASVEAGLDAEERSPVRAEPARGPHP